MLFSSLEFLYVFLPLTLILYFLSPRKFRNLTLLCMSLLFYAYGEPIYIVLMMATIGVNFGFGLWLTHTEKRKAVFAAATVLNVFCLFFFKYACVLFPFLPIPNLPLPVGISFYTFQALSYVADVLRKDVCASENPIEFGTYIALFPQLIAGPIVRYEDLEKELKNRKPNVRQIADGISVFSAGLAKKVLLANPIGEWSASLLSAPKTALGVWAWLIGFSFQIYFDFSGYSDMAIGLGKIFGFEFPENFRYPYTSQSITEFWRRWHITLSSWFRQYVYIPLGGNRCGRWRTYRNLLIVWALTGLWHGASWNFLFWGLYFFLILSLEKAFLGKLLEKIPAFFRHAYALFFILLGWLIFASDQTGMLRANLPALAGIGVPLRDGAILYELRRNFLFGLILCFGATPIPKKTVQRLAKRFPKSGRVLRPILCLASLILCTAYLADSAYNPFLYFRF